MGSAAAFLASTNFAAWAGIQAGTFLAGPCRVVTYPVSSCLAALLDTLRPSPEVVAQYDPKAKGHNTRRIQLWFQSLLIKADQ
jgi:hypothetical protein